MNKITSLAPKQKSINIQIILKMQLANIFYFMVKFNLGYKMIRLVAQNSPI